MGHFGTFSRRNKKKNAYFLSWQGFHLFEKTDITSRWVRGIDLLIELLARMWMSVFPQMPNSVFFLHGCFSNFTLLHPIFIFQLSFKCIATSYHIMHVHKHTHTPIHTLLFCSVSCNRWWVVQHDAFPLWRRFTVYQPSDSCSVAQCTTAVSSLFLPSFFHCIPLTCSLFCS